jgi:DNA-directed RNA polymerase subunit RPC12/RpoP
VTVPATTAEWICTRCGATNRKLVPLRTTETADRCVTCHTAHVVTLDARPVRWKARLDGKR